MMMVVGRWPPWAGHTWLQDPGQVSSESSYCSDTSEESGSEEEGEESEMERRMWRLKKRREELKESLSECWNTVRDKVEFAEHGEFIGT